MDHKELVKLLSQCDISTKSNETFTRQAIAAAEAAAKEIISNRQEKQVKDIIMNIFWRMQNYEGTPDNDEKLIKLFRSIIKNQIPCPLDAYDNLTHHVKFYIGSNKEPS